MSSIKRARAIPVTRRVRILEGKKNVTRFNFIHFQRFHFPHNTYLRRERTDEQSTTMSIDINLIEVSSYEDGAKTLIVLSTLKSSSPYSAPWLKHIYLINTKREWEKAKGGKMTNSNFLIAERVKHPNQFAEKRVVSSETSGNKGPRTKKVKRSMSKLCDRRRRKLTQCVTWSWRSYYIRILKYIKKNTYHKSSKWIKWERTYNSKETTTLLHRGIMTQRLKIFYGLLGAIIGLCVGTFMRNFSTMEVLSRCDNPISMPVVQMKCKFNELSRSLFPHMHVKADDFPVYNNRLKLRLASINGLVRYLLISVCAMTTVYLILEKLTENINT